MARELLARTLMVRLITLLALLLVAGCGGAGAESAGPAPSSTTPSSTAPSSTAPSSPTNRGSEQDADARGAAAPVPDTLRFSATTVGGDPFEGADLAGEPVLLWFWAPWCPTCRSQIPQVEAVAADHPDDLRVIGVGSLDSAEAIAGFADEVSGVTHLEDVDGELWRRFGVTEQSSYVLLDAEGQVAFETGYGGSDDLAAEVAAVLG